MKDEEHISEEVVLARRLVESLEAIADAQTVLAQRALTGASVDNGTVGARVRFRFYARRTGEGE